jgi:hypothetical protein
LDLLVVMPRAKRAMGGSARQVSVLDECLYKMVEENIPVEPSRTGERGSSSTDPPEMG